MTTKRLSVALVLLLASVLAATGQPPPRVLAAAMACAAGSNPIESRGWWTPAGTPIDQYRGVDLEVCVPADGRISGKVATTLHVQLRANRSTITSLRVTMVGSVASAVAYSASVSLKGDAAGDGDWLIPVVLDTTRATRDGWQEFRYTANISHDVDGFRQYQSTGIQYYVANGKAIASPYRPTSPPFLEARGWYPGVLYTNARFRSPFPTAPLSGLWTFRFQAASPSGRPVTYHAVYVDANTHAIPMILPYTYAAGAGPFDGNVTIDTRAFPDGVHKLLLRADATGTSPAGTNSGLLQLLFTVDNP